MPVTVRKRGTYWTVVEKETGKVKGRSTSKKAAMAYARELNSSHKKKGV